MSTCAGNYFLIPPAISSTAVRYSKLCRCSQSLCYLWQSFLCSLPLTLCQLEALSFTASSLLSSCTVGLNSLQNVTSSVSQLRAVFLALKYFLPVLGGYHIIVRMDNMAVPGVLNLAADFLSRQKLRPGEWMLNRQTVSQIWDLFGKAEVDLFASQESSQCPLWFSLSFPTTLGIDAFAHPWPNVSLYAFPPIKLIPAVLCRVKVSGARLLLIAPFWPSQTWFSELTPLLYRPPWEIPIMRDLLSQLQGKIWHPQPELWKLCVWPIQGQGL